MQSTVCACAVQLTDSFKLASVVWVNSGCCWQDTYVMTQRLEALNYAATVSSTSSVGIPFDLASSAGVFWGSFRGSFHWQGVPWAHGLRPASLWTR